MSIQDRIRRWEQFYIPEADRRKFLLSVSAPLEGEPSPQDYRDPFDYKCARYEFDLKTMDLWEDDRLPCFSLCTTTEIWAQAMGCEVFYPENNNPMAIPYVKTPEEAEKVRVPRLEDTSLGTLLEYQERAIAKYGPDTLFQVPDMQTPMDIAAQIWDKAELFPAMYEAPEAVKELASKAKQLLISFFDIWKSRCGDRLIAHFPAYYLPQGLSFSEDEIGNVSDEMFREFFLDELNELSRRYHGLGIHCCANSEHQWKNLAQLENLYLLNLCRPPETLDRSYPVFSPVTAQWPRSLVNGVEVPLPPYPAEAYPQDYRGVIYSSAETPEEAKRMVEEYRTLYPAP